MPERIAMGDGKKILNASTGNTKKFHIIMAGVTFLSGVLAVIVAASLLKYKFLGNADDIRGNDESFVERESYYKEPETGLEYHKKVNANATATQPYGQAGGERDFLFGSLPKMDPSRLMEPIKKQAQYLHYNCGSAISLTEAQAPWLVGIAVLNPNRSDERLTLKKVAERNRKLRNNATKITRVISVCGAVLIAPSWGLTAHHCLSKNRNLKVVLHSRSNFKNLTSIRKLVAEIDRVYFYPNYDDNLNQHDVALFKLKTKIRFGEKVQQACLPNTDVIPREGKVCRYSGWGVKHHEAQHRLEGLSADVSNSDLVQFEVSIDDPDRCQKRYKRLKYDVNYNLCDKPNSSSVISDVTNGTGLPGDIHCSGFSGSPLTCLEHGRWVLYGIVNWGDEACDLSLGRGFALVSTRMKWICCVAKLDIANCEQFDCPSSANTPDSLLRNASRSNA